MQFPPTSCVARAPVNLSKAIKKKTTKIIKNVIKYKLNRKSITFMAIGW